MNWAHFRCSSNAVVEPTVKNSVVSIILTTSANFMNHLCDLEIVKENSVLVLIKI